MAKGRMSLQGLLRTKAVVEKIERAQPLPHIQSAGGEIAPKHLNTLRVTSTTPTSGRYPAKLQFYDRQANTWSDGNDCWLVEVNGATLSTQKYDACLFRGFLAADGLAVFTVLKDAAASFSGARAYGGVHVISTDTTTVLNFDNERFDTDSYHSTVTNTSRLTAPTTAYYLVGFQVGWSNNSTGYRQVNLRLNGTTDVIGLLQDAGNSGPYYAATTLWRMDAADYFEVTVYQNSGINVNITGTLLEFWITRLG